MDYEKRKHNMPISIVIKNYLDKRGGKISVSRKEIEWRFNALDWRYQKQILFAFLQSGMSDRKWAYTKLYTFWDDCFIPVLQELWEQYHEIQLSWLVIRFFPIEYLKQNMESLSKGRNYYFLFQRLNDDKDFVLDRTRLNEADLLAVKCQLGETITDGDVRDLFFLLIYKMCKGVYGFGIWKRVDYDGDQSLLPVFSHSMIKTMINNVSIGLDRLDLVEKMLGWMQLVTDRFRNDYRNNEPFLYYPEEEYACDMMIEHCLKYIAQEYKEVWDNIDPYDGQAFISDLEKRHHEHLVKELPANNDVCVKRDGFLDNPSIRKLIDRFDLEIESPESPF